MDLLQFSHETTEERVSKSNQRIQLHTFNIKTITITPLAFEMIQELSKKKRLKPTILIEQLVKNEYSKK